MENHKSENFNNLSISLQIDSSSEEKDTGTKDTDEENEHLIFSFITRPPVHHKCHKSHLYIVQDHLIAITIIQLIFNLFNTISPLIFIKHIIAPV